MAFMATADEKKSRRKSTLELLAVLLLGIATIATAWCGFQASRWNNRSNSEQQDATNDRIESSRLFTLGAQKVSYDANTVTQYAQAVANEQVELQKFIRANIVRPAFLPTLDKWIADVASGSGTPGNLFTDQEYLATQFADANKYQALSDEQGVLSDESQRHSADYVLITLITATALFFAGVTSSFEARSARLMLLLLAGVTLAVAAARLVGLPVA
jgi:hypothetical protein